MEMEGIHLAYDTAQSILEYNYVQSAINLQVFTHVIEWAFRAQKLMTPDSELLSRQHPSSITGFREFPVTSPGFRHVTHTPIVRVFQMKSGTHSITQEFQPA
jgi:hypothetical protein